MPDAERQRLVRVVTIVSIGALLILALLIWLAFWTDAPRTVSSDGNKRQREPAKWNVNRAGQAGAFKTIQEAMRQAQPNDRVIVTDDQIEEQVSLSGVHLVTLESEPGRTVVWRCPEKLADNKHLLYLDNAEGVRVRGFTLDGGGRVDEIIELFRECPGLILEDLRLRGFNRYGILAANCAGQSKRQVAFLDLEITATKEADAALAFTAHPNVTNPKLNQFVTVRNCRFDGPYKDIVARSPGPAALANLIWQENLARPSSDKPYVLIPAPK
jgi:hypothetical protein